MFRKNVSALQVITDAVQDLNIAFQEESQINGNIFVGHFPER